MSQTKGDGNMEKPYEEFDVDALEREFNESWEPEDSEEEVETEEETETETDTIEETEDEEETEESETEDTEEVEEEEPELNRDEPFTKPKQTKEENAAFAELRRQKEEAEKQAKVVEKFAASHGMTVDQYLAAVEAQEEEARAKDQGVPVDVLRRMEAMERQLNEQKTSSHKEKFWNEVDTVKAKYDLSNDDVDKIFKYIGENGLVNTDTGTPAVPFEFLYKAANFDNVVERESNKAKQNVLAAKKKRQTNTAKGHTNSSAGKQPEKDDFSVDEVEKMLRSEGLL